MCLLFWLTSLARCASPEELLAREPAAAAQLDACERRGCGPTEGASAAWVIALATYLRDGVADGALSAAVRDLDPTLFAALPDVVRAAAGDPPAWVALAAAEPAADVPPEQPSPATFETELQAAVEAGAGGEAAAEVAIERANRALGLAPDRDPRVLLLHEIRTTAALGRWRTAEEEGSIPRITTRLEQTRRYARAWYDAAATAGADTKPAEEVCAAVGVKPDLLARGSLEVVVVDAAGAPIPTATVRFSDELENHRVNTMTGRWRGTVRYLPDGTVAAFNRDDLVAFEVFAPGYDRRTLQYRVGRKRNEVRVPLAPLQLVATSDAPAEAAAVAAWSRWVEAERAAVADRTDATHRAADAARDAAATAARAWMAEGGGERARELCLVTAVPEGC
jgi:hypothetical protein